MLSPRLLAAGAGVLVLAAIGGYATRPGAAASELRPAVEPAAATALIAAPGITRNLPDLRPALKRAPEPAALGPSSKAAAAPAARAPDAGAPTPATAQAPATRQPANASPPAKSKPSDAGSGPVDSDSSID